MNSFFLLQKQIGKVAYQYIQIISLINKTKEDENCTEEKGPRFLQMGSVKKAHAWKWEDVADQLSTYFVNIKYKFKLNEPKCSACSI